MENYKFYREESETETEEEPVENIIRSKKKIKREQQKRKAYDDMKNSNFSPDEASTMLPQTKEEKARIRALRVQTNMDNQNKNLIFESINKMNDNMERNQANNNKI